LADNGSMPSEPVWGALERQIKVRFKERSLLHQAAVHRSFLHEHPELDWESYERLEYLEDTLLLDSGSPIFPHHRATRLGSMALLELTPERVHAEIVVLGETPDAPNPCTAAHLEYNRQGLVAASLDGAPQDVTSGTFRWRPRGAPPLRV